MASPTRRGGLVRSPSCPALPSEESTPRAFLQSPLRTHFRPRPSAFFRQTKIKRDRFSLVLPGTFATFPQHFPNFLPFTSSTGSSSQTRDRSRVSAPPSASSSRRSSLGSELSEDGASRTEAGLTDSEQIVIKYFRINRTVGFVLKRHQTDSGGMGVYVDLLRLTLFNTWVLHTRVWVGHLIHLPFRNVRTGLSGSAEDAGSKDSGNASEVVGVVRRKFAYFRICRRRVLKKVAMHHFECPHNKGYVTVCPHPQLMGKKDLPGHQQRHKVGMTEYASCKRCGWVFVCAAVGGKHQAPPGGSDFDDDAPKDGAARIFVFDEKWYKKEKENLMLGILPEVVMESNEQVLTHFAAIEAFERELLAKGAPQSPSSDEVRDDESSEDSASSPKMEVVGQATPERRPNRNLLGGGTQQLPKVVKFEDSHIDDERIAKEDGLLKEYAVSELVHLLEMGHLSKDEVALALFRI